jgi:hypothetical protein
MSNFPRFLRNNANESAPTPKGAEAVSPMKNGAAPQVGLEPTTLRLTVGAEPFAGQGLDALQRENRAPILPTTPTETPKAAGDSHESPRTGNTPDVESEDVWFAHRASAALRRITAFRETLARRSTPPAPRQGPHSETPTHDLAHGETAAWTPCSTCRGAGRGFCEQDRTCYGDPPGKPAFPCAELCGRCGRELADCACEGGPFRFGEFA